MIPGSAKYLKVNSPKFYKASSKEEVAALLMQLESEGEIHEGVVIRDVNGRRFKWKTKKYLALHRLKDNGNILLPRNLIVIALTGEVSETLAYFPVKDALAEVEKKLDEAVVDIVRTWLAYGYTDCQKTFALSVKDDRFNWILFQMRKKFDWKPGWAGWDSIVRKIMLANSRKVSDIIFGKKVFAFDLHSTEPAAFRPLRQVRFHPEDCSLCHGTNLVHSPDTDRDFEPCPE